jgi:hypothetical protein
MTSELSALCTASGSRQSRSDRREWKLWVKVEDSTSIVKRSSCKATVPDAVSLPLRSQKGLQSNRCYWCIDLHQANETEELSRRSQARGYPRASAHGEKAVTLHAH